MAGNQVVRILACSESVWRQYGYSKADKLNVTSVAWLSQDRLLLGSSDGKVLMIESGELKAIFSASDMPFINFKINDE